MDKIYKHGGYYMIIKTKELIDALKLAKSTLKSANKNKQKVLVQCYGNKVEVISLSKQLMSVSQITNSLPFEMNNTYCCNLHELLNAIDITKEITQIFFEGNCMILESNGNMVSYEEVKFIDIPDPPAFTNIWGYEQYFLDLMHSANNTLSNSYHHVTEYIHFYRLKAEMTQPMFTEEFHIALKLPFVHFAIHKDACEVIAKHVNTNNFYFSHDNKFLILEHKNKRFVLRKVKFDFTDDKQQEIYKQYKSSQDLILS